MSQHNFRHLDTWKEGERINYIQAERKQLKKKKRRTGHYATVEEAWLSLVDEDGSCQGYGNKVDNPARWKENKTIEIEHQGNAYRIYRVVWNKKQKNYVKIMPGAINSVKEGFFSPKIGSINWKLIGWRKQTNSFFSCGRYNRLTLVAAVGLFEANYRIHPVSLVTKNKKNFRKSIYRDGDAGCCRLVRASL